MIRALARQLRNTTWTRPIERYIEFSFPIWAVVDSEAAKQHGASFAIHILVSEHGEADLPVFTSERKAAEYIAAYPLSGHEPSRIDGDLDMKIIAEVFRKRNGAYVRIDDPTGREPGIFCPTLDAFISMLRT